MFVPVGKREFAEYYVAAVIMVILLYLVWRIWKYMKLYAEFPTFPLMTYLVYSTATNKIPKNLPFAGFFFQKLILLAKRFHEEELYLLWGPEPNLIVFGENTVKALVNEQEVLEKPTKYDLARDFFGSGLLTSDVDTWRKHRKLLNPVFHVGMLKQKMHIFNSNADNLVKNLKEESMNETPIDAFYLIQTCAIGVLCEYIFGLDNTAAENKDIIKSYLTKLEAGTELVIKIVAQPWLHFKFLRNFFPIGREYTEMINDLHTISMKVILEMKEKIISRKADRAIEDADWNEGKEFRKSFAHILLDHHLKDNSFTMEDIKYQVSNFIIAGFDGVSHCILWSLFLLGHDTDVQNRAYDEVNKLSEGLIKYEDLQNLVYLECVIKETLRLYPTGPMYGRKLCKDMQCGKYTVPKGTDVFIFAYMLHRNPKVYPDSEKFNPERFQKGDTSIRPENYVPFGHGIRNCIGKAFAMIEMKVILAYILRNFRVTSLERREDVDITWDIALVPVKPLHFRFTPRNYQEQ